ncbi:hypothetical protein SB48_HM08orf05541 [Heyndrickxia coagulans]|uniref:Uncharacterized protein n=1 Tax=Heyndrickxia coagulans TaxID=1398 RepID=A0AAN0T996_HEYCO|nr:hypothetical protein SB48_HM08orf05541 [Heyndrickxia coagulans]
MAIQGLKKKQHMEVHHAILYEGWEINGKRGFLRQPHSHHEDGSHSDILG